IFQMIGGITDFYRSWRGVKFLTELNLIIQNWTLSILIASGVFSIFIDYDLSFKFILQWYVFVDVGFVLSRSSIRFLAGIVRKLGYNTRRVA
ncbi:undecaprenyl-phosphate glucose phosphotransferase, partial [Escherichia coli]|nr:undecaprenyl-phosphate glucose phosphotransferase [Escherichia coli]